jgi:hypothetical protein
MTTTTKTAREIDALLNAVPHIALVDERTMEMARAGVAHMLMTTPDPLAAMIAARVPSADVPMILRSVAGKLDVRAAARKKEAAEITAVMNAIMS